MKKVDQIIRHPLFKMSMEKIRVLEAQRRFCCHDISHSLDVARIAYIRTLEQGMDYSKEVLYGAALLHDIGRWQQYIAGIPHHEASKELAERILEDTDFDHEEKNQILEGIRCHRSLEEAGEDSFAAVLYEADKQSRVCWLCEAYEECYWPEEQKNRSIVR